MLFSKQVSTNNQYYNPSYICPTCILQYHSMSVWDTTIKTIMGKRLPVIELQKIGL